MLSKFDSDLDVVRWDDEGDGAVEICEYDTPKLVAYYNCQIYETSTRTKNAVLIS